MFIRNYHALGRNIKYKYNAGYSRESKLYIYIYIYIDHNEELNCT